MTNFLSFVGLTKSTFYELLAESQEELLSKHLLDTQANNMLNRVVYSQLKTVVDENVLKGIITELACMQKLDYVTSVILLVSVLCLGLSLKALNKLFRSDEKSIEVIEGFTIESLQDRCQELSLKLVVLSGLFKDNTKQRKADSGKSSDNSEWEEGKQDYQQFVLKKHRNKTKISLSRRKMSFFRREIVIITVALLALVPLALMIGATSSTTKEISSSMNSYVVYVQSVSDLKIAETILLDMLV